MESPRFLVEWGKRWFVKRYRLNMEEAQHPLEHYACLNALFTRRLKAGARPIEGAFVHPCDGVISQTGVLNNGQLLQAKGWHYSVKELLGRKVAQKLEGGKFATYYLCPTDYHRVHFPVSGRVVWVSHLVGKLWPVNVWSVHHVKNLFCINERVVFEIKTEEGLLFMVMVGATNVGHITTHVVPKLRTNASWDRRPREYSLRKQPYKMRAGEAAGIFEMGSTVILLADRALAEKMHFTPGAVKMGQSLSPKMP